MLVQPFSALAFFRELFVITLLIAVLVLYGAVLSRLKTPVAAAILAIGVVTLLFLIH